MKKPAPGLVFAVLIAAVVAGASWALPDGNAGGMRGQHGKSADAGQPVPVTVAPVKITDVPIYLEGVGTVKALTP